MNGSFRSIFDRVGAFMIRNGNSKRIRGEGGKWKSNLIWIIFQKRWFSPNIYC